MKIFILLAAVLIFGVLFWRSRQQPNTDQRACIDEIISLLKRNPETDSKTIADVFRQYDYKKNDARQLVRMIKARMHRTGIPREEQASVLHNLTQASHYLQDD